MNFTGFCRLCIAAAVLAAMVYVFAPLPVKGFGPLREYARILRETDIAPGSLFYTDVEQSNEAEMNSRGVYMQKKVPPFN